VDQAEHAAARALRHSYKRFERLPHLAVLVGVQAGVQPRQDRVEHHHDGALFDNQPLDRRQIPRQRQAGVGALRGVDVHAKHE
jgi:hypothetical protein